MRDYIKNQLSKVTLATIQRTVEENCFKIPHYCKPHFTVGHCYIIALAPDIVNNNASALATNWNNGRSPTHTYLRIYVTKILGPMICIDGVYHDPLTGMDSNDMFSGWLDAEALTILKNL